MSIVLFFIGSLVSILPSSRVLSVSGPDHGIRVLPGPSLMWFDAHGERLAAPCFPGFDTNATLRRILSTGYAHSWFVLTRRIIEKELALSGSEQTLARSSAAASSAAGTNAGRHAADAL